MALPDTVESGEGITAALFNAVLEAIRSKLDKTDPRVPKFDEQLKVYIIGE